VETVTWASGLLAKTERLVVFGTVHAPLIPPLIAAKEFVTADHIGEGRSVSISCAAGTRAHDLSECFCAFDDPPEC
jgi:alkanesulfonate monooxygenase SsuD/methylene tetrahydromethanopterin reductase-like flavin-dependent oxidoreductase (luciferase family)